MLYFTQIVFVKEGQEDKFNLFESHVLPLLKKHNGTLVYRVRPTDDCVMETTIGHPYELHLVTFPGGKDFEAYRDDKERMQYMHLKEESIEKALMIAGELM